MKKVKVILLSVLAICGLAGCSKDTTPEVKVTGISLNESAVTLTVDQNKQLTATVTPDNATNKAITWSSSNNTIASVSENGLVTALKAGSSVITAKTVDGDYKATCNFTINEKAPEVIKVTGVSLDFETKEVYVNEEFSLNAVVSPSNATNKSVAWSSQDEEVATINNGLVTAVGVGETTIKVTTVDGGFSKECALVVNEEPEKTIDVVVNYDSKVIKLTKDKSKAEVGDTITLTINAKTEGYEIDTVSAKDSKENTIALTKDGNKYSYALPEDGIISISATLKGIAIKGYIIDDEFGLINGNPFISVDNGDNYSEVTEKGSDEHGNYFVFVFGAYVKFNMQQVDNHIPTGLKVDDVDKAINDSNEVIFKVAVDDIVYPYVDIVATYKNQGAPEGEYNLEITNSTNLEASVYWSKDDEYPATTIDKDIDAVIRVVSSDPERYEVREIVVNYFTTTETTSKTSATVKHVVEKDDEYWTFKVPYTPAKRILITVYETDSSLLKDLNLDGTYLTISVSPAVYAINKFVGDKVVLTNGGSITLYSSDGETVKRKDTINSYDSNKLNTISHQSYVYGKDSFMISTDGDNGIASSFGSYNYVCVKMNSPSDDINDYSVTGERFCIDEKWYMSYVVTYQDKLLNSGFMEMSDKKAYFNADLNIIYGDAINDNKVIYEVKKDSNIVKVIGYNGAGGSSSRCFLGDYYGTYTKGSVDLFIYGNVQAMFDNVNYSMSLVDNRITLTSVERELVIDIDNDNRTYTIVSDQSFVVTLPEFAGKAYRNSYAFEDNFLYYGMYIEFNSKKQTLSCIIASDYNLNMSSTGHKGAYNVDVEYTYNESTKEITANLVCYNNATKLVTMTYVPGSTSKIKISSKVIGGGQFYDTTASLSQI